MNEREPEWHSRLKSDPFVRETFTLEHIQRIEDRAAAIVVEQSPKQRGNWRIVFSVASILAVIIIGIGLYQEDTPSGLPAPSTHEPMQTLPVTQTETPEGNKDNVHRLRGVVEALDSPIAFGSGPISFLTEEDEAYEVMEREGAFVRIMPNSSQSFYTGWIPEWYLLSEGASQIEEEIEPYLLLVDQPVTFSLYPEEPEPSGFELNSGKVVQVTGRYEAWLRVNIVTYDSPYSGDKWILESGLAKWDPAKAKEGILNPGALVYDEKGEVQEGLHSINPIRISSEEGARYRISAAGGYTGLIDKADFIPGPFLKIKMIDQSGDNDGDVDWFMSEEEVQAYEQFVKTKSDHLLKDLEPLVIFRYYVFASTNGDFETQHALFISGEEYSTPDLETFLSDIQSDPVGLDHTKKAWEDRLQYQLEQVIDGNSAAIVMTNDNDDAQDRQQFGLTRNNEGIWKVNWLAMQ